METFRLLVVEYERDGDMGAWEEIEVQANTWEQAVAKAQRPASFVNRYWGVTRVWDAAGNEIRVGLNMRR